ncbi:MAG: MFS transporter, partial [Ktedonobacteraceae bacterium]|nr:MFS transporter [Ktedonobacteraceae bacterium]
MGLILAAAGCLGFAMVDTQTSYLLLACIIAVLGFGLASVLPAMTEATISHAPRAQSGIASGMLNVSRQVGGVIGVAILGTLVDNQQSFVSGMHLAFVIAGGVLLLALVAAWIFVSERDRKRFNVDTVENSQRTTKPAEIAVGTKGSRFKDAF